MGDLHALLDAVKVADLVLFVLPVEGCVSASTEICLSCLLGHGLPSVTLAVRVNTVVVSIFYHKNFQKSYDVLYIIYFEEMN